MQPSRPQSTPSEQASKHNHQDHEKGEIIGTGAVKHVTDTGLPPGITSDEAKDPGNANERGRVDNRS